MNGFDLIIFDCDGVLVDSEKIANDVFARVLNEECGLALTLDDMFATFVGQSSAQCMRIVEQLLGHAPPDGLEDKYKNEINKALEQRVMPVQGIESALAEIAIPYCVASSGSYEKMNTTLGKTGLLKHFKGKLHSTSDVERGKPFPDIYLHASRKMGVSHPSACLVVEDSPLGVRGGVNAGMTVFGYAEHMSSDSLKAAGAHHTFDDMSLLPAEITRFIQAH